jgi:hypothetical protein
MLNLRFSFGFLQYFLQEFNIGKIASFISPKVEKMNKNGNSDSAYSEQKERVSELHFGFFKATKIYEFLHSNVNILSLQPQFIF